jgi:hypothetical protein
MSRTQGYVVLVLLLAVAGCASAPEGPDETAAAAAVEAPEEGSVTPDLVVDANDLVARTPPPLICRHSLKQGSNVIVQRCMTAQEWKLFERREAQEARAIVRTLQGGAYR